VPLAVEQHVTALFLGRNGAFNYQHELPGIVSDGRIQRVFGLLSAGTMRVS